MRGPAERTGLRRLNPITKLGLAIIYVAAASLVFRPDFQIAMILAALVPLLLVERTPPLDLLKLLWPFALIGVGYLWMNVAFFDRGAVYTRPSAAIPFGANPALMAGLTLWLRALAFGAISVFFILTTEPRDLARSLMLRCRLPAAWGFGLLAALQFLPGLRDELRLLRLARTQRERTAPRNLAQLLAFYRGLAIPLLADAIRRADRAAISMEARGLRRPMRRTSLHDSPISAADGVFLVIGLMFLAAARALLS
jgi:energy-coupling factor transport system permease protein